MTPRTDRGGRAERLLRGRLAGRGRRRGGGGGGVRRCWPTAPWDHVVATKDYHIDPGAHFGDPPDYVDSWPVHCVVGTGGVDFHPTW